MEIETLSDLLTTQIQKLESIEDQLIEAIPLMRDSAHDEKLKQALNEHFEATKTQRERLEDIISANDIEEKTEIDTPMQEIIKEGQHIVNMIRDSNIKDTAIMAVVDKVEHYEIAAYQAAISLAEKLGETDIVDLLDDSLDEEKDAAKNIEVMASDNIIEKIQKALG